MIAEIYIPVVISVATGRPVPRTLGARDTEAAAWEAVKLGLEHEPPGSSGEVVHRCVVKDEIQVPKLIVPA